MSGKLFPRPKLDLGEEGMAGGVRSPEERNKKELEAYIVEICGLKKARLFNCPWISVMAERRKKKALGRIVPITDAVVTLSANDFAVVDSLRCPFRKCSLFSRIDPNRRAIFEERRI